MINHLARKISSGPFILREVKMENLKDVENLLKEKKVLMMKKVKANNFNDAKDLNELSSINKLLSICTKELIKLNGLAIFRKFDGQIDKNRTLKKGKGTENE